MYKKKLENNNYQIDEFILKIIRKKYISLSSTKTHKFKQHINLSIWK